MIEPRIYRAALLPAVLAIVLVAFSLQDAPGPVGQPLAADALFDGGAATGLLHNVVASAPNRRPGTSGDRTTANQVAATLRSAGFATALDEFTGAGKRLVNVVGTRPGDTPREIVVIAGRDAATVPDATTSAADTAALMEFAHVFQGTAAHHTLVLASVDGATLGDAGARRLEQTLDRTEVDAVVVLSNLAAHRSHGPLALAWSEDSRRGSISLERTARSAIGFELGRAPHRDAMLAQLVRLAFPIAPGAQAPLLAGGLEAIRVSGSGELRSSGEQLRDVDQQRYAGLGRVTLRIVSALDPGQGPPPHGPRSYLELSGRVLPGWAISVLAYALMLPALIASIDALARAARRREQLAGWLVWLIAGALPFALGLGAGKLLVVTGLGPTAPPSPIDPSQATLDAPAIAVLALTLCVTALAWVLARSRTIARAASLPPPAAPGAGTVTALALTATGTALAASDPYTALVIAPAVNMLMLVCLTRVRRLPAAVMAAAGLAPLAAAAAYYLWHFRLDPLHGAYYALLLVLGGVPGTGATLALTVLLGCCASIVAIVVARRRADAAEASAAAARIPDQPIVGPASAIRR